MSDAAEEPRMGCWIVERLIQHPFVRSIPGRHPERWIVSHQIRIILSAIALSFAEDRSSQDFWHLAAGQMLLPRFVKRLGQRIGPAAPMVTHPQQDHSAMLGQSIIAALDLDRTIERELRGEPLPCIDGMNVHARSGPSINSANGERRSKLQKASNAQGVA